MARRAFRLPMGHRWLAALGFISCVAYQGAEPAGDACFAGGAGHSGDAPQEAAAPPHSRPARPDPISGSELEARLDALEREITEE